MMHRFDLDVDVATEEMMAKLARKKEKAGKKKKGKKKKTVGEKVKDTPKAKKKKDPGIGKKSKKKAGKGKGEGKKAGKKKKGPGTGKKSKKKEKKKKGKKEKKGKERKGKGGGTTMMTLEAADVGAGFSPVRGERLFPSDQALLLGYVDLGEDHPRPGKGKSYPLVSASNERVGRVDFPKSRSLRMHVDFDGFYVDRMPGFRSTTKEGVVRFQASTKDPKDMSGSMADATFVTEFRVRDDSSASAFFHRGVFRNLLLQDWVTLSVRLYEMDPDGLDYGTIKTVFGKVHEIQNLDVLNGVLYLNLAAKLFDGVIRTFARDPDQPLWGELPILEVSPKPGGVFLRTGIYLLGEKVNGKMKLVDLDQLEYRDGEIRPKRGKRLPNHLLFGVSLSEHKGD